MAVYDLNKILNCLCMMRENCIYWDSDIFCERDLFCIIVSSKTDKT